MKYALDTEFIDTPTCSALISLALVGEDSRELYLEFDYPETEITPWLAKNVTPLLSGVHVSLEEAARMIGSFVVGSSMYPSMYPPEFWAYFGTYDWYWFCRVHGGFMGMPQCYPHRFREFADHQRGVPAVCGPEHNALNDARALMVAMKARGVV